MDSSMEDFDEVESDIAEFLRSMDDSLAFLKKASRMKISKEEEKTEYNSGGSGGSLHDLQFYDDDDDEILITATSEKQQKK